MRYTPERRTELILAIRARLRTGASLAEACEAEKVKPTTFIAWMRRVGPEGTGGPGYPRRITQSVVLGKRRDRMTMGGPGSSFNAWVRTKLVAVFSAENGVELWFDNSSYSAWLSDSGRRSREGMHGGVSSIEEIGEAVREWNAANRWMRFDADDAVRTAREAFPWLPEVIEQGPGGP
ncbi:MAG: hypothetical protein ACO3IB_10605 [Phycisphaerales bacterium]